MKACQNAVMTHGGFGYAKEYHVERFLRKAMISWIAPVGHARQRGGNCL